MTEGGGAPVCPRRGGQHSGAGQQRAQADRPPEQQGRSSGGNSSKSTGSGKGGKQQSISRKSVAQARTSNTNNRTQLIIGAVAIVVIAAIIIIGIVMNQKETAVQNAGYGASTKSVATESGGVVTVSNPTARHVPEGHRPLRGRAVPGLRGVRGAVRSADQPGRRRGQAQRQRAHADLPRPALVLEELLDQGRSGAALRRAGGRVEARGVPGLPLCAVRRRAPSPPRAVRPTSPISSWPTWRPPRVRRTPPRSASRPDRTWPPRPLRTSRRRRR